jgi:hypothetical protein
LFVFLRWEWTVSGDFRGGDLGAEFWTRGGPTTYEDVALGTGTVTCMVEVEFCGKGMDYVSLLGG